MAFDTGNELTSIKQLANKFGKQPIDIKDMKKLSESFIDIAS